MMTPFLFRFAERLPDIPQQILRYDAARQMTQALTHGEWVDAPDARDELMRSTRFTKVRAETTDDA